MDDSDPRRTDERLHILDAMAQVIDRRTEFLAVVGEAESAEAAWQRLQDDWGFDDVQATAALDLQMRRFAERERARITGERDELLRNRTERPA